MHYLLPRPAQATRRADVSAIRHLPARAPRSGLHLRQGIIMFTEPTDVHEAAFSGDIRQLQKLIEVCSENVNRQDRVGQTPLHKAAMNGWLVCVNYLVEKGAHVNTTDISGCTALHLAAANGYREIAKDLIEKGHANVDHKTNKGHTPRYMAKSRGQMQMVAFFDYLENKIEKQWLS